MGLRVSASHGRRYSIKIYLRGMLLLHAQGMKAEVLCVYDLPLSHQPDQMPPSSFLIRTNYSLSFSQSHSTFTFLYFCFCGPALPRARSASGLPMPPRYIAGSFSSASKHHHLVFFLAKTRLLGVGQAQSSFDMSPNENANHPHEHEQK